VVGVVENPADLDDEFALASASGSEFAQSGDVATLLVRASDAKVRSFRPASDPGSISVEVRSATEKTTAAVLVLVVSTVAMLLISLIAAASFVSIAQRRLRQLGMFAAVGGTTRQLRLVMIANGAVVGLIAAVLGTMAALATWIVVAPAFESAASHRVDRFGVPWWALAAGFALAIIAASAAAWLPARAIARVSIVQALSGRPPRPRRARRSALAGLGFLAVGVAAIGSAIDPGQDDAQPLLLIGGLVAVVVAILFLAIPAVRALAVLAPRLPVGPRLAVRDLARYQARAGAALAAISLGLAISISIVAAAAAAENQADEGNLSPRQLIVWAREPGPDASLFMPVRTPAEVARLRTTADAVARVLGSSDVLALDAVVDPNAHQTTHGQEMRASVILGRPINEHTVRDAGVVYVATPALLARFGIDPATINPGTVLLSHIPGEVYLTGEITQVGKGRGPVPPGSVQQIPAGAYSSAPRSFITEAGLKSEGWEGTTSGWLVDAKQPVSDAQVREARRLAAEAGLVVEARDAQSGLGTLRTGATAAGILLALGIVAMTVSLLRGESAHEAMTLTACGATSRTRRAVTATTAASLAALAVVLGGVCAYAALIAGYWGDTGTGLQNVPVANLVAIAVVLPLVAAGASWLVGGRELRHLGRAALE
jgi:putative ABC transport system permease protein